ncbi:AraC family transcriptional regulator [Lentimicrobium sp. S6]|uniref:AraC family transcriptional regulator n=1 Tax=Lentimicrobium sp. S6 TaxID=2735872 RepID=UPI001551A177|nr:AraC family transcriptional regulator [Lentimicrobium sp. S6]NPD47761.1 AraC family transcriptional regulator [Lentimicrobium sp. S6]
MTNRIAIISLIFMFLAFESVLAQYSEKKNMQELKGLEFREAVRLSFDSIRLLQDFEIKEKLANDLLVLSSTRDVETYIGALIFNAEHFHNNSNKLFKEAYRLAEENNMFDAKCLVEYSRAQYFIERKQYDSAMIYILHYREMTPEGFDGEGYRNILNLLGDIYYHAGLYKQAEKVYLKMYHAYVKDDIWNFYRPFVMMNNMGQIALKKGAFDEAQDWFQKSLKKAKQYLDTDYKNNTIAYINIKLAETAILQDELQLASKYLAEVQSIPEDEIFQDVRQEYIYFQSLYLSREGQLKEAEILMRSLMPEENRSNTFRLVPQIYSAYSDILYEMGHYSEAIKFYKKYHRINDSLQVAERLSQSMIILANENHLQTQIKLGESVRKSKLLMLGILVLLILLSLMVWLYLKLYQSKLKLVKRSIDCHSSNDSVKTIERLEEKTADKANGKEVLRHKKIIEELRFKMQTDKIYLNPQLNILETSKLLNTNRTYLSQAINHQLNTTFPNYINEYRIKEAIRLITTGYAESHTQEALAKKSGFANRSVFISAFKKNTGVLPSFFIENHRKMKKSNPNLIPD